MNIAQLKQYCDNHDITIGTYQEAVEILNNSNAKILSYSDKGIAYHNGITGENLILYNDDLPNDEKYQVLAHEIGHHVLQHLTSRIDIKNFELEANIFASVLMALSVFSEMK